MTRRNNACNDVNILKFSPRPGTHSPHFHAPSRTFSRVLPSLSRQTACHGVNRLSCNCEGRMGNYNWHDLARQLREQNSCQCQACLTPVSYAETAERIKLVFGTYRLPSASAAILCKGTSPSTYPKLWTSPFFGFFVTPQVLPDEGHKRKVD